MSDDARITWALRGTIIDAPGPIGETSPMFVLSRCDVASVGYYCETHAQPLANVGNLVMHLESPGEHHIAVWCPTHRVYEAPDNTQMELLASAKERSW